MAVFIGFCLLCLDRRQTDRPREGICGLPSFLPSGNLSCIKYQGKTDGGKVQRGDGEYCIYKSKQAKARLRELAPAARGRRDSRNLAVAFSFMPVRRAEEIDCTLED